MQLVSWQAWWPHPQVFLFLQPQADVAGGVGGGFELLRRETHLLGGGRFKASLRELPGEALPSWVTWSHACPSLGKEGAFMLLLFGRERYRSSSCPKECGILHLTKSTASASTVQI